MCALAALAVCIYVTFEYLPLRSVMADNADVLFAEDIARALNAGGQLFDWRLSHVTYLFPDILFARVLSLGVATGDVAAAYQVLFGVALLAMLYATARVAAVQPAAPVAVAGLLYLSAFGGDTITNPITVHFGLIGEHSGMLIEVLAALIFFHKLIEGDWPEAACSAGLFGALFLGLVSDSLAGIIALPPMAVWLVAGVRGGSIGMQRAATVALLIAAAVAFGKLFSYLNPFPQDRDFLQTVLSQLPASIWPSIRTFAADLARTVMHSPISAALLVLTVAGYSSCATLLVRRGLAGPAAFVALTVLIALPLTLLLQLGLGLYSGIALARHWAPVVYLTVALGAIVAVADRPRSAGPILMFVTAGAAALAVQIAVGMSANIGRLPPKRIFDDLVACMKQNAKPGWLYLGDYWISRPVRLYSGGAFGVVPSTGTAAFTNQANIRDIRQATPEYLITGYSMKAEPFIARFGQPSRVFCGLALAIGEVQILDYSTNERFKNYAREQAKSAD